MFGKVFASTFTGSMFGAGPVVFSTWLYILSNKDEKGYVEVNAPLLAVIIGQGTTSEQVENALFFLQQPDQKSRSKEEEGRRIVREGEFLYRVVNHGKYRAIKNQDDRREQNRDAKRRERSRAKDTATLTFADCQHLSSVSAHTDTDTDTEKKMANGHTAVAMFCEAWKGRHGTRPSDPAIDRASKDLKSLMAQHGQAVFGAALTAYFASKKPYVLESRHDPKYFATHFDEFSLTA